MFTDKQPPTEQSEVAYYIFIITLSKKLLLRISFRKHYFFHKLFLLLSQVVEVIKIKHSSVAEIIAVTHNTAINIPISKIGYKNGKLNRTRPVALFR